MLIALRVLLLALAELLLLQGALASGQALPKEGDWSVKSIVRSIDLGAVSTLSDVHIIHLPISSPEPTAEDQVSPYFFALSSPEARLISGLEAIARYGPGIVPKQRAVLRVKEHGPLLPHHDAEGNAEASPSHLYSVTLPFHFLQRGNGEEQLADITLTVSGLLTHASEPLPRNVGQSDQQYLLWKGSVSPISPYGAGSAKVRVKSPQPTILSYSSEPALAASQMMKSGSTVTFGPFSQLPSVLRLSQPQAEGRVHYLNNSPVLTIVESKRQARISHWRNRLTIRDDYWLRNDGARLKGHFSRVQHQRTVMLQRMTTHALTNVILNLPPGADDAFFVDESGNVSTSHFRRAPPSPAHVATPAHLLSDMRASILDFRPRYPLLGGWNYTCSVGWSVKLTDGWVKAASDKVEARRYSAQIPFMAAIKDVAVDDASLRIVLPEGAKDISFNVPFGVDVQQERQWSFLDTMGKPVLILHKRNCSERHGAMVIVEYTLSAADQYRKLVVALLAGLLIGLALRTSTKINVSLK